MKLSVTRITFLYFLVGIAWIIVGDLVLFREAKGSEPSFMFSLIKGSAYVILTALGLHFLLRKNERRLQRQSREYQRLFKENPNPMWIYDTESLKILAVNKPALTQYDYSRKEFLQLSILDLCTEEEKQRLAEALEAPGGFNDNGIWMHRSKSGRKTYYHIYSNAINFKKHNARLVVAINVDEQVKNRQKILKQNKKLMEIAHMQSHDMRGPLSSIMGLITIFDKTNREPELNTEVLEKLELSAQKLDRIISNIVDKTQDIKELD